MGFDCKALTESTMALASTPEQTYGLSVTHVFRLEHTLEIKRIHQNVKEILNNTLTRLSLTLFIFAIVSYIIPNFYQVLFKLIKSLMH